MDESVPETLGGEAIPAYIAQAKANAYQPVMGADELVITADTIVWIDNEVLGKPESREDAICMLRKLSGASHQVITGVCSTTIDWHNSLTATREVTFAKLTNEELEAYV